VTDTVLFCEDDARRAAIAAANTLHGIDYVEIVTSPAALNQLAFDVFFIQKRNAAGTADLGLMLADFHGNVSAVRIEGGVRERSLRVLDVARHPNPATGTGLRIRVDRPGDFSDYTLQLTHARLDPRFRRVRFNFKAGCPSRFDCRGDVECLQEQLRAPNIDYLAKDYASFRQALLDLAPTLMPQWGERHAADLNVTLLEMLAHAGDHLSYYQDAVANEAWLGSARQRISVRRHARLIDYRMHDGASARAFVFFEVTGSGAIPVNTSVITRVTRRLGNLVPPLPHMLPSAVADAAIEAADTVFEVQRQVDVDSRLNGIPIYTWGDRNCCLPTGTTHLDLEGDLAAILKPGDFLLLEEIAGPSYGLPGDAAVTHRQVVRLQRVSATADPLLPPTPGGSPPAPLTHVEWNEEDALRFPLCLSAQLRDGTERSGLSIARGNIGLVDAGRTVEEWHPGDPVDPAFVPLQPGLRGLRLKLRRGPLAFSYPDLDVAGGFDSAYRSVLHAPHELGRYFGPCDLEHHWMKPRVFADVQRRGGAQVRFEPRADLLTSASNDPEFAVETDNEERALLRFGDGEFGMATPDDVFVHVTYRVGGGAASNVGTEAIAHVVDRGGLPTVTMVRNPIAAGGGTDPQSLEQVKLLAPEAIRGKQYRAVTEDDYARAAERHPAVAHARATFRWTGSWHTVFVSIDPKAGYALDAATHEAVRAWVQCYTQTGYDLEVTPPVYVPLDIAISICVRPGHFRGDVEQAVLRILSSRASADGSRGFFHPDNFTFGEPLYLSRLYKAIAGVDGVESAQVTKLQRFGVVSQRELDAAIVPMGRLEIIRLDNDPSLPERGVLQLTMLGGA
jgi:hypothetical protein